MLIDKFDGKPLNSPNEVVVKSDGSIWFSDPPFGILANYEGDLAQRQLPTNVYRLDPQNCRATVVIGDIFPNGLCFSPDERKLYVVKGGIMFYIIVIIAAIFTMPAKADGLKEQLVGAWAVVSSGLPNGIKPAQCVNPNGIVIFDASGRYAGITAARDRP